MSYNNHKYQRPHELMEDYLVKISIDIYYWHYYAIVVQYYNEW